MNQWLKAIWMRSAFPSGTQVRITGNHTLVKGSLVLNCTGLTGIVDRYCHWSDCFVVLLDDPPHHELWLGELEIQKVLP
jgi:hypothetical protein